MRTLISNTHTFGDYFPFGMRMLNRSSNSSMYRFGFNGQELDDEIKGEGNSLDFGARMYDPRIARWLSVDPKASHYPSFSTYIGMGGNPIKFIDSDGREIINNEKKGTAEWRKVAAAIKVIQRTNSTLYNDLHSLPDQINITIGKLNPDQFYSAESLPDGTQVEYGLTTTTFSVGYPIEGVTNIVNDDNGEILGAEVAQALSNNKTNELLDDVWKNDQENYNSRRDEIQKMTEQMPEEEANKKLSVKSITIELDPLNASKKSFARTLAHELGHAKFSIVDKVKAYIWSKIGSEKGHDTNNPGSEYTKEAEDEFDKNY